jgi:hypothetical protein
MTILGLVDGERLTFEKMGKDGFPKFSAKPAMANIATGCRQRALFRALGGLRWHGCLL